MVDFTKGKPIPRILFSLSFLLSALLITLSAFGSNEHTRTKSLTLIEAEERLDSWSKCFFTSPTDTKRIRQELADIRKANRSCLNRVAKGASIAAGTAIAAGAYYCSSSPYLMFFPVKFVVSNFGTIDGAVSSFFLWG